MIPAPLRRRLFLTLLIIAITCFSTGLVYKDYATKEWFEAVNFKPKSEAAFQQCKREGRDCAIFDSTQLENDFKEMSKESNAVAFWWFLVGWLSVAIMAGYPVVNWIVTGKPFGSKQNPTPQ